MPDTLLTTWEKLVREAPGAPALIDAATARVWTRAGLTSHAAAFAAKLDAFVFPDLEVGRSALDAGCSARSTSTASPARHRRVTFALPNGPDWFAAFLGLLKVGAVPVPLDPSEPAASQLALAASARAAFAIIDGRLVPAACDSPARAAKSQCLVKLTSGSTGRPRALAFTHAQMLADGRQVCASMGITPGDLNLAVIPLGHSYGLGNLVVPLLAQGTPLACAAVPLPHALAADIARWKPTVFPAVPALLRALAASDLAPDALAGLRTVISAGSPLPAETARAFREKFSLVPHNFYGSSETGGIAYDRSGAATLTGRSVGSPMVGVTLAPVRGGRIRVTGAAVVGRGAFSPADRAQVDALGELVLQGRAGRLVKIAGRRLDLGELEKSISRLPGVRDAFVAPHPDTPDQLAAVVATALPAGELRALLRTRLAAWKTPRRLVPVPEFPLTARGKPDARALRALLAR